MASSDVPLLPFKAVNVAVIKVPCGKFDISKIVSSWAMLFVVKLIEVSKILASP